MSQFSNSLTQSPISLKTAQHKGKCLSFNILRIIANPKFDKSLSTLNCSIFYIREKLGHMKTEFYIYIYIYYSSVPLFSGQPYKKLRPRVGGSVKILEYSLSLSSRCHGIHLWADPVHILFPK